MDEDQILDIDHQITEEQLVKMVEELDSNELEDTDKYVMRELLRGDKKDLFFKTDLNFNQIRGIVRLLTIDKIMKAQSMTDKKAAEKMLESVPYTITELLMKLMVSNKRKGRLEFIKAWIGGEDNKKDKLLDMSRWTGR